MDTDNPARTVALPHSMPTNKPFTEKYSLTNLINSGVTIALLVLALPLTLLWAAFLCWIAFRCAQFFLF
ncbi:hypothetical protein [Methylobacterium sp. JK268]